MCYFGFLLVYLLCTINISEQTPNLHIKYEWSQLEFDYPNEHERQKDINSKTFIPGASTPMDVDVHYCYGGKRVFIAMPRFVLGMPVTFGTVTDRKYGKNPVIRPYPSWNWHRNAEKCNRDRIISVYRVAIDECQRLWVLDTGRFGDNQTCPPQILAFDLRTDNLIHRYEIPSNQIVAKSILVTPIVQVLDPYHQCKNTFVYVADCQGNSIIVYDAFNGVSWKVSDKTFNPDPKFGTYTVLGDSFELLDGVLGMALSPCKQKLYYHAMSSGTEHWVYTADLRNRKKFENNPASSPEIFHTYKQQRQTQVAAEAMDKRGIMYFGLISNVTLNCWNSRTEYGPKNIKLISNNQKTLQFATGLKVIKSYFGYYKLWFITSRIQKVWNGLITPSEINFRIQFGRIDSLISGTGCSGKS